MFSQYINAKNVDVAKMKAFANDIRIENTQGKWTNLITSIIYN